MKQQGGQPVAGEWAKQQKQGVDKQQSQSGKNERQHGDNAQPMDEPLKKHGDPLRDDLESK